MSSNQSGLLDFLPEGVAVGNGSRCLDYNPVYRVAGSRDQRGLFEFLPEETPMNVILEWYPVGFRKSILRKIRLPGKGDKPPDCEGWSPTFFCPKCGMPHFTKGNCHRSTCPDCEIDWRFDRCQSILERTLSYKIQRGMRCRHFVVSPYPSDFPETVEDLKSLRLEAYEFAKSKGVLGGVLIFHPFRILSDSDFEDNFKGWKRLLKHSWDEILKCVYYSPHFHILAFCEGGVNFDEAREGEKFVWKGIRECPDSTAIGKCAMYLLSHAGTFPGNSFHSVVWFGSLSASTWSLDRANVRLRNGSTVREFVLDLVREFIGREHEELSGPLECDNCGSGLLHISSAPDYFDLDLEFSGELKNAYWWWKGSKPPPEPPESEGECWEFLRGSERGPSSPVCAVEQIGTGVTVSVLEIAKPHMDDFELSELDV